MRGGMHDRREWGALSPKPLKQLPSKIQVVAVGRHDQRVELPTLRVGLEGVQAPQRRHPEHIASPGVVKDARSLEAVK